MLKKTMLIIILIILLLVGGWFVFNQKATLSDQSNQTETISTVSTDESSLDSDKNEELLFAFASFSGDSYNKCMSFFPQLGILKNGRWIKVTEAYNSPFDQEKHYLVNDLRDLIYPLNSREHQMKMEIVEEFARQGTDYWSTKIPESAMKKMKETYPDTWEEYIEKY